MLPRHAETQEMINNFKNQIAESIQEIKPTLATPRQQSAMRVHLIDERPHRISRVRPRISGHRKKEVPQAGTGSRNASVQDSSLASVNDRYTTTTSYDQTSIQTLAPVQTLSMCSLRTNHCTDLLGDELPSATCSVSEFADEDLPLNDIEAVFEDGQILLISTDPDDPDNPNVMIHKPIMLDNGECNLVDEKEMVFCSNSDTEKLSAFLGTGTSYEISKPSTRPCAGFFNISSICYISTGLLSTDEIASGSASDLESEASESNSIRLRRTKSSSSAGEDILISDASNHGVLVPVDGQLNYPQPARRNPLGSTDFNSTNRIVFCIQEISRRGNTTEMRLRVQCEPSIPCRHATVEILDGERTRDEAENFQKLLMICFRKTEFAWEPIRYHDGVDLSLFDKCRDSCRHTLVEEFPHSRLSCMDPACFGAWSEHCVDVNDSQAQESISEEIGSSDSQDEMGSDSDNRVCENEGRESGANGSGEPLSMPCVYCREEALRPRPARFHRGYRCGRCGRMNVAISLGPGWMYLSQWAIPSFPWRARPDQGQVTGSESGRVQETGLGSIHLKS